MAIEASAVRHDEAGMKLIRGRQIGQPIGKDHFKLPSIDDRTGRETPLGEVRVVSWTNRGRRGRACLCSDYILQPGSPQSAARLVIPVMLFA